MSYSVEIIESSSNILEVSSIIGDNPPTIEILQDNISNIAIQHDVMLFPSDFDDITKGIISTTLVGSSGVVVSPLSSGLINISTIGLQPSGNYSVVGHTHSSSNITDFSSGVSGLLPVKNITAGSGVSVSSSSGNFTVAITGQFGLTDEQVDDRVAGLLKSGSYVNLNYEDNTNALTISVTGLQPSGSYAPSIHNHNSSDINDFSGAVSGLLPVKDILSGSGISINNTQGNFTVSVTGQFGLTSEQVDDRVSNLLKAGNYVNLNYDDNNDSLTIGITGLQPSGNYSTDGHTHSISEITNLQSSLDSKQPSGSYALSSHTHTASQITDFDSNVSGLLPVKNITGSTYANVTNSSGVFNISITGLQPSGSYANTSHTHIINDISGLQTALDSKQPSGNYSLASHTHISSNITDFNSSVSGLLPVKNVLGSGYVNVSSSSGNYTVSVSGLQPSGNYADLIHNHGNITSSGTLSTTYNNASDNYILSINNDGYIAGFSSVRSHALWNDISDEVAMTVGDGEIIWGTTYTDWATVFRDSIAAAPTDHYHGNISSSGAIGLTSGLLVTTGASGILTTSSGITSSYISNFNSSVSGLLPVKDIVAGTGIAVSSLSGTYTVNSTLNSVAESASIVTSVFNKTGSPIPKMSVVYINGGQGDQPTISLAIASGEMTSSKTYGITQEAISNMSAGKVVVLGALTGVNTDQFNPNSPQGDINGTTLWLSPTIPGSITTTKPSAPYHMVSVGTVVRTHQNEGVIEVRIQNGFELEELHNVAISGVSAGQYLQYNGSGLWVPTSSGNFNYVGINSQETSLFSAKLFVEGVGAFGENPHYVLIGNDLIGGELGISTQDDYLAVKLTSDNTIRYGGTDMNPCIVISSGSANVGIGTATPSGKLEINGNLRVKDSTNGVGIAYFESIGASGDALSVRSDAAGNLYLTATNAYIKVGNQTSDVNLVAGNGPVVIGHSSAQTAANQFIRFGPAGTERMRLNASGYLGIGTTSPSGQLHVVGTGIFTNNILVNDVPVSVSGHAHSSSDITNFNSSVSGLLPSISGIGYITSSFSNNIYTISTSGLQPSGNYSLDGHTHLSSNITDFNSSVSGLLPITNIVAGSNISISASGTVYTISSSGVGGGGIGGSGTSNYLSKWTNSSTLASSIVYDNGTNIGIGSANPSEKLEVAGNIKANNIIHPFLLCGGM